MRDFSFSLCPGSRNADSQVIYISKETDDGTIISRSASSDKDAKGMSVVGKEHVAVSPGDIVRELLAERSMGEAELPGLLRCTEKEADSLLNGEAELSQDMASKLEAVFGLSSGFWENMENQYGKRLMEIGAERGK